MKAGLPYIILCYFLFLPLSGQTQNAVKDSIQSLQKSVYFHKNQGNYEKALTFLNKAIGMAESTNDNELQIDLFNLYTQLHIDLNKIDKAAIYIEATKNVLSYYEYRDGRSLMTVFEAYILAYNQKYPEAIALIDSVKFSSTNKDFMSLINYYEGMIYFMAGDLQKSERILEKMLPVNNSKEAIWITSRIYITLARIYFNKGNFNAAEINATKACKTATANNFHAVELLANKLSAEIYEANNDYKNAYRHLTEAVAIEREYFNPNIMAGQNAAAEGSQLEFMGRYIEQLNTEIQQKNQTVDISKLTSVLSSALLIIISLLTISLYRNNQIKFKTNDLLLKKNLELQIAKDEAEKAMKAKAQFLSTVSHELRTPLYAVTGLTHLLLEEDPKESQKEHLNSLKFSGEYLLNFINDILQINKIEANKLTLEHLAFDLRKVINDVATSLYQTAKENRNTIKVDIDKEIPNNLLGDSLKLSQIFINLVGNALKFTENGTVTILANKMDMDDHEIKIHFEVSDQGIGISKEMQENIFESFSQGSIQINRKYGGTGLGLTIVKSLLSLFRSDIKLKSELGKGSTFMFDIIFSIPESEIIDKDAGLVIVDNSFYDKLHLLVVEDNKINQVITQKMLAKKGMTCDIANDGYEALEKVRKNNYDCILMDIHMPGISGLKTTQEIRKFNTSTPIIALTAISLDESKDDFFAAGCDDIVTKPFKPEIFYRKIAKNILKNIDVNT